MQDKNPRSGSVRPSGRRRLGKTVTLAMAGVLGAGVALTACSSGTSASSSKTSGSVKSATTAGSGKSSKSAVTHSLTIGIPPAVTTGSLHLAQDKGIFAKNHLVVSLKIMNGGAATVPALESGAINLAQSNVLSVIQGANTGINEPCFAGAFRQGHIQALISGANTGITKPSQLAGKSVAINALNGINQLITEEYLQTQGVQPSSVHFVAVNFPDMTSALSSGSVDAVLGVEPFNTEMLSAGDHLLSNHPEAAIPGNPIFSCWNASASWLKTHQTTVKDFMKSMQTVNKLIAAHPTELVKELEKQKAAPDSVLEHSPMPIFTLKMSNKDVKEWEAAAKQYGILQTTPPASEAYYPPQQ